MFHFRQGLIAHMRQGITRKREQKDQKYIEKLFRKDPVI